MVFVSVSNENGLDLVPVFNQVTEVGDNDIHPRHCFSRKSHSCIYYDNFVAVTEYSHVLPDFPQASQGNDL